MAFNRGEGQKWGRQRVGQRGDLHRYVLQPQHLVRVTLQGGLPQRHLVLAVELAHAGALPKALHRFWRTALLDTLRQQDLQIRAPSVMVCIHKLRVQAWLPAASQWCCRRVAATQRSGALKEHRRLHSGFLRTRTPVLPSVTKVLEIGTCSARKHFAYAGYARCATYTGVG